MFSRVSIVRRSSTLPAGGAAGVEALEPRRLLSVSLVKDINTAPYDPVLPMPAFSIGHTALFRSAASGTGSELWKTDGTAAGTHLLKDLLPGPEASSPRQFTRVGDLAYFTAATDRNIHSGGYGETLWRSDGTAAGTFRLADTNVGPDFVVPLGAAGSKFFFLSTDQQHGREIWVTDGTTDGTRLVKDLAAGTNSTAVPLAGAVGDRLLFQVTGQTTTLYSTDGTDVVSIPLGNIGRIQPGFTPAGGFIPAGNVTYFVDQPGSLWRTDGTPAGTVKVLDRAWPSHTMRKAVGGADGAVFVETEAGGNQPRLYRYHPDSGLAEVVRAPNSPHWGDESLTVVGSTVYLVRGILNTPGYRLHRIVPGATTVSAVPGVPDFIPVDRSFRPIDFTVSGGDLYFRQHKHVWKIDDPEGSPSGSMLAGTMPGSSYASGLAAVPGGLVSLAHDPAAGWALYKADAAAGHVGLLADLSPLTLGSNPLYLTPFNGKYLFRANDGAGIEPWVTDGTAAGTFKLADTNDGTGMPDAWMFTPAGAVAYFSVPQGHGGTELWVTDGTVAGTRRVKVTNPVQRSVLAYLTPSPRPGESGVIYFSATGGNGTGQELWRSDGTEAGTFMVTEINTVGHSGGHAEPRDFTPLPDNTLLFTADDGWRGRELWQTDGTAQGTRRFKDIRTDDGALAGSAPSRLTRVGDFVYFTANDGVHGYELWRTDGTPEGTVMVADLAPGPDSSHPANYSDGASFVPFRGHVYFEAANSTTVGLQVWRTDGTEAGTVLVKELAAPKDQPAHLRVLGDRLYFTVNDAPNAGSTAGNLWSTDGTAAGTAPVLPAGTITRIESLTVLRGKLYFRGTLPSTKQSELFTSDGTAAGTFLVDDLGGDTANAQASGVPLGLPDGSILMVGNDGVAGVELFRYGNPWEAKVVGRHVFYDNSAYDGRDPGPSAADDGAIAPDKAALLPGQAARRANVTSYARGINGVIIDVSGKLSPATLAGIFGGVDLKVGATDDFATWRDAPRPSGLSIRPGAGAGGSDRVTLTWADGAIKNTWLRVAVNFPPHSDVLTPDVFYFGNLVGDAGAHALAVGAPLAVDGRDVVVTRAAAGAGAGRRATIRDPHDHNRDGVVSTMDYALSRMNFGRWLTPITAPPPAVAPAAAGATATLRSRPPRRSLLADVPTTLPL